MTATITRVEGGETSTWHTHTHTQMCTIPSTAQHTAAVCRGVLQLTVALSPQHLFGFPRRKHASCSTVTFDSLRSETAHQLPYYVLKEKNKKKDPPSIPKSKGGKNPRGAALKLTAVIVPCHLARLPGNRKGLIFYDVW